MSQQILGVTARLALVGFLLTSFCGPVISGATAGEWSFEPAGPGETSGMVRIQLQMDADWAEQCPYAHPDCFVIGGFSFHISPAEMAFTSGNLVDQVVPDATGARVDVYGFPPDGSMLWQEMELDPDRSYTLTDLRVVTTWGEPGQGGYCAWEQLCDKVDEAFDPLVIPPLSVATERPTWTTLKSSFERGVWD